MRLVAAPRRFGSLGAPPLSFVLGLRQWLLRFLLVVARRRLFLRRAVVVVRVVVGAGGPYPSAWPALVPTSLHWDGQAPCVCPWRPVSQEMRFSRLSFGTFLPLVVALLPPPSLERFDG